MVKRRLRNPLKTTTGKIVASISAIIILAIVGSVAYIWFHGAQRQVNLGQPTITAGGTGTVYTFDQSQSEARFTTHEILFGKPNTVVGKTNQIVGKIQVDLQHADQAQVSEIRVNVDSLATDNELRNRALRGNILETSLPGNDVARFDPKQYQGLPTVATIGQQFTFQATGDLTIHHITLPETFAMQVTVVSAKQLMIYGKVMVHYTDFAMSIPNVPNVSDVSNDVLLEINAVAKA